MFRSRASRSPRRRRRWPRGPRRDRASTSSQRPGISASDGVGASRAMSGAAASSIRSRAQGISVSRSRACVSTAARNAVAPRHGRRRLGASPPPTSRAQLATVRAAASSSASRAAHLGGRDRVAGRRRSARRRARRRDAAGSASPASRPPPLAHAPPRRTRQRRIGDAGQRRRDGRRRVDHLLARIGQRQEGSRRDCRCPPRRRTSARADGRPAYRTSCRGARDNARAPSRCAASPRSGPPRRASRSSRSRAPRRPRAGTARCWWARCAPRPPAAASPGSCPAAAPWLFGVTKVVKYSQVRRAMRRSVRASSGGRAARARTAVPGRLTHRAIAGATAHSIRIGSATGSAPGCCHPTTRRHDRRHDAHRLPCDDRIRRAWAARAMPRAPSSSIPAFAAASRRSRTSVRTIASVINHAWYGMVVSVSAIWAKADRKSRATARTWLRLEIPGTRGHTPANAGSSGGMARTTRTKAVQSTADDLRPVPSRTTSVRNDAGIDSVRRRLSTIFQRPTSGQAFAQDPRQQLPIAARPAVLASRGRQVSSPERSRTARRRSPDRRARTAPRTGHGSAAYCPALVRPAPPRRRRCRRSPCRCRIPRRTGPDTRPTRPPRTGRSRTPPKRAAGTRSPRGPGSGGVTRGCSTAYPSTTRRVAGSSRGRLSGCAIVPTSRWTAPIGSRVSASRVTT